MLRLAGEANSGKNFFFDMVVAYYINTGYCANIVRGQMFPFNDCINRRLLFWNEINFCNSAIDTIKSLTGGDTLSTPIKFYGNQALTRTPLICLSNNELFNRNDSIWSSRIFFENWRQATFLRDLPLYPHPLTFYDLIKKYVLT